MSRPSGSGRPKSSTLLQLANQNRGIGVFDIILEHDWDRVLALVEFGTDRCRSLDGGVQGRMGKGMVGKGSVPVSACFCLLLPA